MMAVNPYGWASPNNTQGQNQSFDEWRKGREQWLQTLSPQDRAREQAAFPSSAGVASEFAPRGAAPMQMGLNQSASGLPNMNIYSNVNQGQPFNYSPPSMSDMFSGFLGGSVPSGNFNEDFWRSQKSAGAFQAYSQNLMQPLMNYYLQSAGQQFQNAYNQAALNEQIRLNNLQNALAQAASAREERALAAQLGFNERDFAEMQRQFNQRFGLDERSLALQRELGLGRLGLDRDSLALQRELGMGRLDLDRLLGTGRLDLERELGMGRLGLDERSLALQRELGLGELGLGRQRLDLDTRALQQEADLMRERLANEMIQSRYAAFGRSQAPSFRMMNTF